MLSSDVSLPRRLSPWTSSASPLAWGRLESAVDASVELSNREAFVGLAAVAGRVVSPAKACCDVQAAGGEAVVSAVSYGDVWLGGDNTCYNILTLCTFFGLPPSFTPARKRNLTFFFFGTRHRGI